MPKSSWWYFFYYILKKPNCIIVFIYKKAFEINNFFNKLYENVHFLLEMIIIIQFPLVMADPDKSDIG